MQPTSGCMLLSARFSSRWESSRDCQGLQRLLLRCSSLCILFMWKLLRA